MNIEKITRTLKGFRLKHKTKISASATIASLFVIHSAMPASAFATDYKILDKDTGYVYHFRSTLSDAKAIVNAAGLSVNENDRISIEGNNITIYHACNIEIISKDEKVYHFTDKNTTLENVLNAVGLGTENKDSWLATYSDGSKKELSLQDFVGSSINKIEQCFRVTVHLGQGEIVTSARHGLTVSDILTNLGISPLYQQNLVASPPDAKVEENSHIYINCASEFEEKTVQIPFETESRETNDLPKGQKKVIQEGRDGESKIVVQKDGNKEIPESRKVTRDPVKKIILEGTKAQEPTSTKNTNSNKTTQATVAKTESNVESSAPTDYSGGYRKFIVRDTGGAIKGNRIDIWLPTYAECIAFGRRTLNCIVNGKTVTFVLTAYCLPGTTASGYPVGPNVCAADVSLFPFGTEICVPWS